MFSSLLAKSSTISRSVRTPVVSRFPLSSSSSTLLYQHYPFLPSLRFRSNRSRRGLYDGKDVKSGNKVSFSNKTTKRKFKPNVFIKRVYSEVLDQMVRFHLTAATLRSIDKMGGLDNYLLKSKHVTEGEGLVVKRKIITRMKLLQKLKARGVQVGPVVKKDEEAAESEAGSETATKGMDA